MPTYEYACTSCGEHLEVVQSFRDEALTTCPACNGALRKVFGSIGVVFKGSGFYKTDSRPAAKDGGSTKEPSADKTATAASKDSSGTKETASSSPTSGSTTPVPQKSGSDKSGSKEKKGSARGSTSSSSSAAAS